MSAPGVLVTGSDRLLPWRSIDDVVMGGRSASEVSSSRDMPCLFRGYVSLEDGGGFASVRALTGGIDLSACAGVALRVRGDGRRYRLRLKDDERLDGVVYQAGFETAADRWVEARLAFDEFVPSLRGRIAGDAPPLDTARIEQVGLLIADRQEGPFRLEVGWIAGFPDPG